MFLNIINCILVLKLNRSQKYSENYNFSTFHRTEPEFLTCEQNGCQKMKDRKIMSLHSKMKLLQFSNLIYFVKSQCDDESWKAHQKCMDSAYRTDSKIRNN